MVRQLRNGGDGQQGVGHQLVERRYVPYWHTHALSFSLSLCVRARASVFLSIHLDIYLKRQNTQIQNSTDALSSTWWRCTTASLVSRVGPVTLLKRQFQRQISPIYPVSMAVLLRKSVSKQDWQRGGLCWLLIQIDCNAPPGCRPSPLPSRRLQGPLSWCFHIVPPSIIPLCPGCYIESLNIPTFISFYVENDAPPGTRGSVVWNQQTRRHKVI